MLCSYGCNREGIYKVNELKVCCSFHISQCPEIRLRNKNSQLGQTRNEKKYNCKYCNKITTHQGLLKHEEYCIHNPKNRRGCKFCGKQLFKLKSAGDYCNHTCANKKRAQTQKGINHPNFLQEGQDAYKFICFHYHEHKCIICGEKLIVEVHHFDHNRLNNEPSNLIPVCSTHHRYLHSRYKKLIISKVVKYKESFSGVAPTGMVSALQAD